MSSLGAAFLAFAVAASVAVLELITSTYPRTSFLLIRSRALWLFGLIYGLIGFAATLALDFLVEQGKVQLEGAILSNSYFQAAAIGLSVKAFLHLRIFSVKIGPQTFPVGVETVVQLFEPWLLREIELFHFNAGRQFIHTRAEQHSNLEDVKGQARANLPRSFSAAERDAFLADLERAADVEEVMELFLGFLGRSTFDRVFPP